jgi:hypothetical protein
VNAFADTLPSGSNVIARLARTGIVRGSPLVAGNSPERAAGGKMGSLDGETGNSAGFARLKSQAEHIAAIREGDVGISQGVPVMRNLPWEQRHVIALVICGAWMTLGILLMRVSFKPGLKRVLLPIGIVIGGILFIGAGWFVIGTLFSWPFWVVAIAAIALISLLNIASGRICLSCGQYFQVPLFRKATLCGKCRESGKDVIDLLSSAL